jgi:hypothetical protein
VPIYSTRGEMTKIVVLGSKLALTAPAFQCNGPLPARHEGRESATAAALAKRKLF